MATLMKASGETAEIQPWNGASFTLEELQEHVGGYVEKQRLSVDKFMLMDEDGKQKGKPINREASLLLFGRLAGIVDFVVGDVLVGTQKEFGGGES
jgi:hypothetical protein